MKRRYKLTKNITAEEAEQAMQEIREIPKIQFVEMSEDHKFLTVQTGEDDYYEVMTTAMNICERSHPDCSLSFDSFIYD